MLALEQAVTIQILHQQGKSIKAITRELGVSRNTEPYWVCRRLFYLCTRQISQNPYPIRILLS
nr:helix-turn-helix domain-containing protein [Acinetobacter towneri]